ncbi:MAG TPA: Nif3-like dinuclear metal center hexameric protein [Saprospiraceae bacterium]|nr:Nif3-like dinuclear metal center hexameric protein [Saprospiraceae bacterium]
MSSTVGDVTRFLETIAPLQLQESYDNSGLLIGNVDTVVSGIVICLECTEDVIDEAIRLDCNMVISHHPAIFYGLKKLTGTNYTERIVRKAIKEDIVLYSIHTNLDNVLSNGVNERIAQQLGAETKGILSPGQKSVEAPATGAGIIAVFNAPMMEVEFLQLLKERMNSPVIRHSRLLGNQVETVAICGGSGSFLLEHARRAGVQALVTADYKYHGFFDADGDLLICDIGHYESEQYTINLLQDLISGNFTTFAAHCTGINTNPVHYFT